jgi:RNA polymerase sigma-70 factor (ECF subfamily)
MADAAHEIDKARRFRDAALPHLDAVYTLARYLLRNAADADDAVQECYLRALRHFDGFRGLNIRPWLLAILRNVCRTEYARRCRHRERSLDDGALDDTVVPLWHEGEDHAEPASIADDQTARMRRLIAGLPEPFRETLVLREIEELSYRDIAEAIGAPVGTVMSRLARARALLRDAWSAAEQQGGSDELR